MCFVGQMNITKADFELFMAYSRKLVPGFTVHDGKRDSYLMNFIDGLIYPFNPGFMDKYITTIGGDVYYPKGRIGMDPRSALETAGHELQHAYDVMKMTFPVFIS